MFHKSARYYDAIYSWKDYDEEVSRLHALIQERCPGAKTLLDVACGTGIHLELLKDDYELEGLDLDPEMIQIARDRLSEVQIHQGDMRSFELAKRFDVVLCLFSSIGYVPDPASLNEAIAQMARHLESGGLLIVEPWLSPDQWETNSLHAIFVDEPDIKIARISDSALEGRTSVLNFHHLVGTATDGVTYFEEEHRLTLFTHEECMEAFHRAGMDVDYDPDGLMGRGLYIAMKGS
jgi:SAM-dependent methyltransferase